MNFRKINAALVRHYLMVAAMAFIFITFGVWELINPQFWNSYVPSFLYAFNLNTLVTIHGAVLTLAGLWLLSGKFRKYAAILSTLIMLEIVGSLVLESGFSPLLVRDATILIVSVALIFDAK